MQWTHKIKIKILAVFQDTFHIHIFVQSASLQIDETSAAATNSLVFYSLNNQKERDPYVQLDSTRLRDLLINQRGHRSPNTTTDICTDI